MKNFIAFYFMWINFLTFGNTVENPDGHLQVSQIIAHHNYPAEAHTIATRDGYFLTLFRIPFNPGGALVNRQPVLVQHGVLCSAASFVTSGEMSLAFMLSQAGYDVWLGNFRGNGYSNFHLNYTTDRKEFWDFSFDELSQYDLSAMIDYIELITKQYGNLLYVGHSMGTTAFFALLAGQPQYNNKIKAMFALAPVAYLTSTRTPLRHLATIKNIVSTICDYFQVYAVGLAKLQDLKQFFAPASSNILFSVINYLFSLGGFNFGDSELSLFETLLYHAPSSSSVKTMLHFSQLIESKEFKLFDYGLERNLIKYKQETPPLYDLNNIKVPVNLYYSTNDWFAGKTDTELLASKLPNRFACEISHETFNHVSFIWANMAPEILYTPLINNMLRFSKYRPVINNNLNIC